MALHEPHLKGRKSSWPQYSNWQFRPIDSRSVSAISLLLGLFSPGWASALDLDMDMAVILGLRFTYNEGDSGDIAQR